jgi:hypothetical protein
MKKLLYFCLLLLWGCSQTQAPTGSANLPQKCSDQPTGELNPKDVESISITDSALPISKNVTAGRDVGFTFKAQKGQRLSYQTKDDLCIWIIAPDTKVITGGDLPQTGKYTLQVALPQGSKTVNLEVSFGNLIASPQPSDSSAPSTSSTASSDFLDQATALQLVNDWLSAKSKIFAAPFDRNLVSQYTTGPLYTDITKPNGAIDWLINNGSYYQYNSAKVNSVVGFSGAGQDDSQKPSIRVSIYEDRTLYGRNGVDSANSGTSTQTFDYFFQKENGTWKIYDYRKPN